MKGGRRERVEGRKEEGKEGGTERGSSDGKRERWRREDELPSGHVLFLRSGGNFFVE